MTREELAAKILELEGRIASLEMRDDYTPAAESPVMEVPAPEKVDLVPPPLFTVKIVDVSGTDHVYCYCGGESDSSTDIPVMVGVRPAPLDGSVYGWVDLGAKPASGNWRVLLSAHRNTYNINHRQNGSNWTSSVALVAGGTPETNASLFPSGCVQPPQGASAAVLRVFYDAERPWKTIAAFDEDAGTGLRQVSLGAQVFARVALDQEIYKALPSGGAPWTKPSTAVANHFLEWRGGVVTLCIDGNSGKTVSDGDIRLFGAYQDDEGAWGLCVANMRTVSFLGTDGRQHSAVVVE